MEFIVTCCVNYSVLNHKLCRLFLLRQLLVTFNCVCAGQNGDGLKASGGTRVLLLLSFMCVN